MCIICTLLLTRTWGVMWTCETWLNHKVVISQKHTEHTAAGFTDSASISDVNIHNIWNTSLGVWNITSLSLSPRYFSSNNNRSNTTAGWNVFSRYTYISHSRRFIIVSCSEHILTYARKAKALLVVCRSERKICNNMYLILHNANCHSTYLNNAKPSALAALFA